MNEPGHRKTLPGPFGLPLFGYLPFIGKYPHKTLAEMTKKYGPVFRVQMGTTPCLVLGTYEAVKEAFVKQNEIFSGRSRIPLRVLDSETAFIFDEGDSFKDVRLFSIDVLRKLGFGRLSLEPTVKLEAAKLMEEFKKFNGDPSIVHRLVLQSIGNAICNIIGSQTELNDPWLCRMIDTISGLEQTYNYDYIFFWPWLERVPILRRFTKKATRVYWKKEMWRLWKLKVDKTKADIESGVAVNNFISMWFEEAKLRIQRKDPNARLYEEFNLISNLDILTQGAFETTSNTILWALHYLAVHQDKQERLREEIDCVTKDKGDLSFADSKHLPYFKAFIQEVHRKITMVPLGLFHCNREEATLFGYHIPKRIMTIPNAYAVHYDERDFPDPEEFKPERFLTDEGSFIYSEKVIPFSIGKRFCPGESVAQMEIFNVLLTTLQTFIIKRGPNYVVDLEATAPNSLVRRPKHFKICLVPRNH